MSIFCKKKSFIESGLLYYTTDIHSHVLPGVDDGAKTYDEAVEALRWLNSKGVDRMYLTPHIMTGFPGNRKKFIIEQFVIFKNKLEDDGIGDIPELRLGAEYMLEPAFETHKNDGYLTYSGNNILVETSYIMPPMGFVNMLEDLMEDGYTPVLAHPERYAYMNMNDYKSLKSQGVLFQLNFLSMTGAYGRFAKEKAIQLLLNGYYDFTGSDFHHLVRHESDYITKSLSKKQTTALLFLFENNNALW